MKSIDLGFILIFFNINPKSSVNISQAFILEKEIFPLVADYNSNNNYICINDIIRLSNIKHIGVNNGFKC